MVSGRKVITVEMKNGNDEVVVRGRAEVEQPKTAYVFTGQGSADTGMVRNKKTRDHCFAPSFSHSKKERKKTSICQDRLRTNKRTVD